MTDEDLERMPYAALWLAELGGTVPQAVGGWPVRRRRRPQQLRQERPGASAPDQNPGRASA